MESETEQIATFAWSKFLLIITSVSVGVPLADSAFSIIELGEYFKTYSYFVAAGSGTIAFILYLLKFKDKIKENLKKEIEKNCPPEGINEKETQ